MSDIKKTPRTKKTKSIGDIVKPRISRKKAPVSTAITQEQIKTQDEEQQQEQDDKECDKKEPDKKGHDVEQDKDKEEQVKKEQDKEEQVKKEQVKEEQIQNQNIEKDIDQEQIGAQPHTNASDQETEKVVKFEPLRQWASYFCADVSDPYDILLQPQEKLYDTRDRDDLDDQDTEFADPSMILSQQDTKNNDLSNYSTEYILEHLIKRSYDKGQRLLGRVLNDVLRASRLEIEFPRFYGGSNRKYNN
jgi:hypothetical protein